MVVQVRQHQTQVWARFTGAYLPDIRKKIIVNMAPEVVLLWVKYSAPAQTHADRTQWMRGMKVGAPAAFFAQVVEVLEKVLKPVEMEMLRFELG